MTHNDDVAGFLSAVFGVIPIKTPFFSNTDEMIENAKEQLVKNRIVNTGDTFVITAGVPAGISGNTNMLKIIRVD